MVNTREEDPEVFFRFAHDLRSYLRTVLTRLQLLENSTESQISEEDRALLQEALTAASDIHDLIAAMTAYTAGTVEEGRENLRLLLRGLVMDRKPAIERAGGRITVENELTEPVPSGLKSVLREVINNACRFRSPDRPLEISIRTRFAPSALQIEVSDNGIGVEEQYIEKVFRPFFTVHPRHEFPGFGLGLATSRRIVESWGGTISAASVAGRAFTISLTLPLEKNLDPVGG